MLTLGVQQRPPSPVCACVLPAACRLSLPWLPADLINVFEVFLPQLLLYPNPTDPLNGEAAALLMREPAKYNTRVKGEQQGPAWAASVTSMLACWCSSCVQQLWCVRMPLQCALLEVEGTTSRPQCRACT